MKDRWWAAGAAFAALLVGASYAYLMLVGLATGEQTDDPTQADQGFWFEFWISVVTILLAVLIVALFRLPAARAGAGAAGALTAAVNCVFIVAGGMPSWDADAIALPPAVVGLLFAETARRAWYERSSKAHPASSPRRA
jgi:peptidoglycan/LPS O-acetylase OafA/YrhL